MRTTLTTVLAALTLLFFIAASAHAVKPKHETPAKTAKAAADAPSAFCQEYPDRCKEHSPTDAPVKTDRERCLDRMGNSDGYVSPWEINAFAPACM